MTHQDRFKHLRDWTVPEVSERMFYGAGPSDYLSPDQHKKLMAHLLRLLYLGEWDREQRNGAMEAIETDLLGMVTPTGTDCERREKRIKGRDVSIPDAIYPFGWLSLQKFASEIMSIVMPVEAPYAVVASAGKQDLATAMVKALRHQAAQLDHRNNIHAAIFDTVALDLAAVEYTWDTIATAKVDVSLAGSGKSNPQDFSGPRVRQLDPYNISWDPACDKEDVMLKGEYFAHFDLVTPFELERISERQNFLSPLLMDKLCEKARAYGLPGTYRGLSSEEGYKNYFYYQPVVARARDEANRRWGSDRETGRQTDHSGTFAQHLGFTTEHWRERLHRTVMYVRIKPSRWGLGSKLNAAEQRAEKMQVWEIHFVAEGYICFARPVIFGLDRIPCALSTMNYRRQFGRSFRHGEHAAQIGLLASSIMNMHKRALRKGLEGGLTIYNPKVFDFSNLEEGGSGRLAARMQNFDDDIRRHIMQLNDLPDIKNSMNDVAALQNMLADFFPSNSQPAMMGLDRATQYQAQAVMLTAMRALIYYASLLDGQLMTPTRFAVHHLNLLNPQELAYVDEARQELITVAAEDYQSAEFELVQSQPLMGIDRLRAGNVLRDILNIMMQSQGQLPPIADMILEHFIQIEGVPITMEEYRAKAAEQQEFDARRMAMEAGAPGSPVAPGGGDGAMGQAVGAAAAPPG